MSSPVKPSLQRESPMTRALADISAEKWSMYQNDLVPVENQYMEQINAMNKPDQYELAGGMAQAEAMRQYQPMIDRGKANLMQAGAAPNSGAFTSNMAGLRMSGATGASQAQMLAQAGQQDRYRAGLESVMGIGNGQSTLAQNSMTSLAQQSVDAAKQQAANNWAERSATVRGLGQVGGMLTNVGLNAVMNK